ncbi:sulfide/dihydroorotate dehydrogenase-like FAD/NAD-binding protein [Thermosyntropha sp.]|uniref:sulfide/dihydroorotate dehydrogenase-like FAD/NAD-binding protein n=1 Tax=Thermosyntropha sp. TaxID=2740820 RepID=UPI0025E5FBE6|nr:sulfide/dihydroorotate dehydrogenase-like FAD/NAD-binding protein [Thermosyntropha sp.]MBO8159118.1 sulfide/dihydroorotate dehydrogenase-like FAD/NAD-binding protein [Thermosyntropha sp.]
MYTIKDKILLAPGIKMFMIDAPSIAQKAKPGQFVIVRKDEYGERIPLTIADSDKREGTITIIFQEVGRSTQDLGKMEVGDMILDLVGPLGRESEIDFYGTVICVGGGVGVAPIYPITRALHMKGNRIISIIGARSADYLIWLDKMDEVSDEFYVTTDDGSYGRKGFVTEVLTEIMDKEEINMVMAIGPIQMMEAVSRITKEKGIKTLVSLNPIMLDGTGMCGACRVQIGDEVKFACVDGPEFDGHLVDWENAKRRLKMFEREEKIALTSLGCRCCQGGEK